MNAKNGSWCQEDRFKICACRLIRELGYTGLHNIRFKIWRLRLVMELAYTGLYNIYEFFDKIFGRRLVREHASLSATEISNAGKGRRTPLFRNGIHLFCSLCSSVAAHFCFKVPSTFPSGSRAFILHVPQYYLYHAPTPPPTTRGPSNSAPPTPTKPSPPTWQPTPSQRGAQPQRHGATSVTPCAVTHKAKQEPPPQRGSRVWALARHGLLGGKQGAGGIAPLAHMVAGSSAGLGGRQLHWCPKEANLLFYCLVEFRD